MYNIRIRRQARDALLDCLPNSVGNVYVADLVNNRVLKLPAG
jgi:hypothetical protein